MVGTRRRSKQILAEAAAAASPNNADGEHEATSQITEHSTFTTPFVIHIPPDLSLDVVSQYVPEGASLTAPTPDTIVLLYKLVTDFTLQLEEKAGELDDARAAIEKKEVEVEQTLVDHDNELAKFRSSLDETTRELSSLRRERDEIANSKNALQSKLDSLSSAQSHSSTEAADLHRRIDDIEREKRDLIGVVDRMKSSETDRQQEIDSLRDRLKSSRAEVSSLQIQIAELKSSETSSKFKTETLQQELLLVRQENERFSAELTEKIDESANFRRQKVAEVIQLQSQLDSITQTASSTQSQLDILRQSHASQTLQLNQSLQKINDLKSQLADQESKFRSENQTQSRLVTLLESRSEEARKRVEEVESEWEKMVSQADEREQRLQEKLDFERQKVDALEQRIADMHAVIEKMGSGELPILATGDISGRASTPGTPQPNGANGDLASRVLSPTANFAQRYQKSGKTFTEVYADYVKMQGELQAAKLESKRLEECLSQILADIEERAPVLQEQRLEYERVQKELRKIGPQLAESLQESELFSRKLQAANDTITAKGRENALLERQLSDLGRQVRELLRELAIRDDPSLAEVDHDMSMIQTVPDQTDTDVIITDKLTLFKSIESLQEQNQRLLKVTRDVARRMEESEREWKEKVEMQESDSVRRAKDTIKNLTAKVKADETQINVLRGKVDTLSRLLKKREEQAVYGEDGSNAANGDGQPIISSIGAGDDRLAEMNSLLKEFGANTTKLQEELGQSQKEVARLSVSLAKANAQIDFLNERRRLQEQTQEMQNREIADVRNRNSKYQATIASLEIAVHRAEDQVRENGALGERLKSENNNLKAEKNLLKSVQDRLSVDNEGLAKENSRLNSLLRDTQTIQNDSLRAADSERRRFEGQIQSLESQMVDLRSQLSKEFERNRLLGLQKDMELKELQAKIDAAARELSATREKLVVAQANETHHQTRIEDLIRQLEGNSEKLAVYERRPEGAAGEGSAFTVDQLEKEVADLRAALKTAELDVQTAKEHVTQFQEISAANEQTLAELQQEYDEYKASTTSHITQIEAEIQSLQSRLRSLNDEFTTVSDANAELRRQLEEQKAQFEAEKRELEHSIADVNEAESKAATLQASIQEELKRQSRLVQEANQKYERAVVDHAEAITAVSRLKEELSQARSQARDYQTSAETAQANLVSARSSWETQRSALDQQIAELKKRSDDLVQQNNILHQHLETVNEQAASIRQAANATVASLAETDVSDPDSAIGELRSVVTYLRREKEIVELQLDLNKQENARLKTQVDHLSRSLEETRSLLTAERENAAQAQASANQHAELMDKINQLNILRESNATLRAESEAQSKRASQLEGQLQMAMAELDPLKDQVRDLKAELETREQHVHVLEEESDRWKKRNTQLLSQYKQVDPEDLRLAKEELENVRSEKVKIEADVESLKTENAKIEAEKQSWFTKFEDIRSKFKGLREQAARIQTNNHNLEAEKKALQEQLSNAGMGAVSVEETNSRITALTAELDQATQQIASLKDENTQLQTKIAELTASPDTAMVDSNAMDALTSERDSLRTQLQALQASHEASSASWSEEKGSLETKIQEITKEKEKHLLNAKQFFKDKKAALMELNALKASLEGKPVGSPVVSAPPPAVAPQPSSVPSTAPIPTTAEPVKKAESTAVASPTAIQNAQTAPSTSLPPPAIVPSLVVSPPQPEPTVKEEPQAAPSQPTVEPTTVAVSPAPAEAPAPVNPTPGSTAAPNASSSTISSPAEDMSREAQLRRALLMERKKQRAATFASNAALATSSTSGPPSVAPAGPATTEPTPGTKQVASGLPNRPSLPTASTPAPAAPAPAAPPVSPATATPATATSTTIRGRGRGGPAARGGRGAATTGGAGRGRGVAAAANAAAASATAPTSGGMSISGAAKRPLEESDPTGGDLAKRLRTGVQRNRQPPGNAGAGAGATS
ncbi:hypothetical protein FRC02_009537 [Tulasnella sp. 418]|nr:hypothetical protein FRC02_009537 [Tulasnella sp. 418]